MNYITLLLLRPCVSPRHDVAHITTASATDLTRQTGEQRSQVGSRGLLPVSGRTAKPARVITSPCGRSSFRGGVDCRAHRIGSRRAYRCPWRICSCLLELSSSAIRARHLLRCCAGEPRCRAESWSPLSNPGQRQFSTDRIPTPAATAHRPAIRHFRDPRPTRQTVITANPTMQTHYRRDDLAAGRWVYATPMPVADADDRPYWGDSPAPWPGVAPGDSRVDMDTDVTEGGIITNKQGHLEWQTVPFIAVQYRETAPVGAQGNSVISGHVVTINEGNVFRNLYKVNSATRSTSRRKTARSPTSSKT